MTPKDKIRVKDKGDMTKFDNDISMRQRSSFAVVNSKAQIKIGAKISETKKTVIRDKRHRYALQNQTLSNVSTTANKNRTNN